MKNKGIMYDPEVAECALKNWNDLLEKRSSDVLDCSMYQNT